MNEVAITGASGELGRRVAQRLAARGQPQRLVVRDASRAPLLDGARIVTASGYDDMAGLRAALDGIETLLLVSASEHPRRVDQHIAAVDAAVAAGVTRIVYTSFLGAASDATFTFARDHFHTEEHIRASRVGHVFLRNSIYLDFIPEFVGSDGVIRGPAGDGRLAPVARDDVADVAAVVLTDSTHDGTSLDLTGPRGLTLAEAADALSAVLGQPIRYHAETLEEAYRSRSAFGVAEFELTGWVTSYATIAAGELDLVTDTVARIAGHEPLGLAQYLSAGPDAVARLRARLSG
jgi:NAD(P)H dehydrogenase (quinone)